MAKEGKTASNSQTNKCEPKQHSSQRRSRVCFHFKIVGIILLLLFIIQIYFFYFIADLTKKEGQITLEEINYLSHSAYKDNPFREIYNITKFDALEIKLADISESIKQYQQWAEFQQFTNSTLNQLKQQSNRINQLAKQIEQIQKIRRIRQETIIQYLDEQSSEYRFLFPKKIWIFDQLKEGYFEKMNEIYKININRVGTANSFDVQMIDSNNFFNFVSRTRLISAIKTLQILRQHLSEIQNFTIPQNTYQQIERTLIMLLILENNGGIIVSKYLAFVENLDWLRQIVKNIFINRRATGILPKVFGFYNISKSSSRIQEKGRKKDNRFKFLVKYPGIISYFLVAVKGSNFVQDLINQIFEMLKNPVQFITNSQGLRKASKVQSLYFLSQKKIYEEYFEIATTMVLLKKEKEMSLRSDSEELIGLDHYGIVSMNANYGPEKTTFFFQNNQGRKILQHLTKYDIKQFELQIGKVRYISRLPSYYELNDYVNNLTAYQEYMIKNSYFHLHFYPDSKQLFVKDRVQIPIIYQNVRPWVELPKIIWIYWHTGLENSNIIYQLCADNMKRYGEESGFEVKIVSDRNLQDYLDSETIDRIEYAVNHQASIMKSKYINYDLIRLALVAKYGGVYMDLSYIMLDNFNWLLNIARYPSNLIFNRYGQKPKNFMFFHPHYGSPFMWNVDPILNTKVAWQLGYENNFIAAQKGSELIVDWFNELLKAIQTPYEDLEKQFIRCDMHHDRWTTFNDIYLLSMDIIKYVLGKKQKELEARKNKLFRDASDYYKLWSMNGYMGQQKFRSHTSYDTNNHDNLFLRSYSEEDAELMIGKTLHLTKLYNYPVKYLMANFISNYDHLDLQFHEDSIFMKYIFNSSRHSMVRSGKNNEIQQLVIYDN